MNVRKLHRLAAKVAPEYALCLSTECQDAETTDRVKWILQNVLTRNDRELLLLYADRQSLREVARDIDSSHNTVRRNIIRIRGIIFENLEKFGL